MNQSKKGSSLPTTRLSPLAKPFTINRSTHHQQPTSNSSLLSTQEPSLNSIDHCNDDPFSSLLDSFRKSNLGSKVDPAVSVPLDNNYGFGHDTVKTTLPVETATQTQEKSLFEQNPPLEFHKNGDFDGFRWSHFDILEDVSLPTCSTKVTGLGYGNEVSYGKQQGVDFHGSLFGKGNDVGSSVDDGSMLQPGKHGVDGLNPCLAVPDGIFKKSTGTIGGKEILSNSIGTTHTADKSSSFHMSNCKVTPLKLSTTNMSSKNTPQIQTSENSGDSDSDVDSPCWKGTVAFCPTPSENSGPVKFHHVEKATEKNNSLNPLAPQFFPGIGIIKDDLVPSNSSAPVATNLLSGEDLLMRKENDKGIELQHSSNIYGKEKAFNMLNDKKCGSVDPLLNSYCMMTQPFSKEDCSTSKGKLATIVDVDDFVKGTKDPKASGSISGVFPSKVHSSTTTSTISSSRVGDVNDLFKTLQDVLKSLVNSPKPDCQTMVGAMHVISELLVQTCVDRAYSYNEHGRDMVQQIINNMNILSTKIHDQRIPTSVPTCADSPYCLDDRSLELPKGLEVTSIKTLAVPQEHYLQNNYMQKNSVSEVLSQSRQYSFASSSSQGTEKGNEIAQFQLIRKSLGKTLDFEKQMHPEALLFRNLWLDSEAERCYRRYKTYRCLMEAGMDVNCTNVAESWR